MPTVEWAEVQPVARSAQALRDKPDQSGDVFAAVFDSTRRSIGSRVDRTIREQQDCAADERKKLTDKSGEEATRVEPKHKGLEGPEEAKKNEQAAPPKPVKKEKIDKVEPERADPQQADPRQPDPADEPSQVTEPVAAEQLQTDQPAPEPPQQNEVDRQPAEAPSRDPRLTVRESPIEMLSASTQTTESMTTETAAQSVVSAVANPVAATILNMLTSDQACEPSADQGGAPKAPNAAALQASTRPVDAEQAAQPISGESIRQTQEPSMSVWQFLRGVAAHLEQVIEAKDRTSGHKLPGARLQQAVAGEPAAGQRSESQIAKVLMAAGLENGPTHKQTSGQDENSSREEGATSQASSGEATKSAEGSTQQAGTNDEFRGLLELAGRVRERIISPDLQPASTFAGRDLAGKGVNLNEARAMTDLADVVRANIGARHSSMTLRLDPPELGQLRVDVRMHGEELALRLQADTLAGRDALQSRLSELRSSLEQHGFKLNQVQIELRVPQGSSAESHQDRAFQQPGNWDGQASHEPAWQGHAGGGSETSSESESMNEGSAFSQENASSGEEQDRVGRLAETGVDLVV